APGDPALARSVVPGAGRRVRGPLWGAPAAPDSALPFDEAAAGGGWRLVTEDGDTLIVPAGAQGAEALVDALVPLGGFRVETARRVLAGAQPSTTVWRRRDDRALDAPDGPG
ncbi:MAG: hypothetical protein AAF677_18485, partial [Pseudomonadota bacterium]